MLVENRKKGAAFMNNVNKTLYIPLYGKSYVSRLGILLQDPKAEQIWAEEGFSLKGKAKSKWLAYTMGMRSAVFDRWVEARMEQEPEAIILHAGCGMDSRCLRIRHPGRTWFDVDFPEVMAERARYFSETADYRMIPSDLRNMDWLQAIEKGSSAIIVMEGVSMYLTPEERNHILAQWAQHFSHISLLMDTYTTFGAKASKYKNPINEVGVTQVYGMDKPGDVTALPFLAEHDLTPEDLIRQLKPREQAIFRRLFAGSFAKKLYRLYEYRT